MFDRKRRIGFASCVLVFAVLRNLRRLALVKRKKDEENC